MATHDTSAAARAPVERDRASGNSSPSAATAAHPIHALQRVVGNQATGRLLAASAEREDGEVQPLAERLAQGRGAGLPLADAARTFLEPRLGYDLGAVRVHHDAAADDIAGAVNATAFTTGTDLYFRSGAYDPHSPQGLHLLAHEVTHVVQQSQGPVSGQEGPDGLAVSDPGDAFEREAESVADAVIAMPDGARGEAPASLPAGDAAQAAAVQRSEDDDSWFGGIGDLIESAGSSVSDAAGEAWDAGSSAVSSAGSAIASGAEAAWDFGSDAASGVASAASTAYHGMQAAGHAVHGATEWVEGGIGDLAAMSRQGWDMMAEQAQGIPVVEDLARGAAWVGGNTADFTGGVLKGATGLVGGLAGMVVNPVDTAIGLEGMAEHIRPIPGMANPLQVAHGLYNVVANGADLGGEMNRTLNPLEQMRGDSAMMEGLVRGIARPYVDAYNRGNYGEMAGRGAFDLALLLSGVGEAGAAAEGAEALGAVGEGMRGAGAVGEGLEGAAALGEAAAPASELSGMRIQSIGTPTGELAGLTEAEIDAFVGGMEGSAESSTFFEMPGQNPVTGGGLQDIVEHINPNPNQINYSVNHYFGDIGEVRIADMSEVPGMGAAAGESVIPEGVGTLADTTPQTSMVHMPNENPVLNAAGEELGASNVEVRYHSTNPRFPGNGPTVQVNSPSDRFGWMGERGIAVEGEQARYLLPDGAWKTIAEMTDLERLLAHWRTGR